MAGGMAGGGQEEKKGPVALDRSRWTPLGSLDSGAGGRGMRGGMSGMSGMKGGVPPGAGSGNKMPTTPPGPGARPTPPPGTPTGTPIAQPGASTPGGSTQPSTSSDDDKGPKRTEFIILFIWKEPIPSDDLRGLLAAADGGGNSQSPGVKASDNNQPATPSRPRRSRGGRGGRGRGKGR